MPKISIIIPVYNVENYLSDCLNSLINQTFKDIEIICVNDGSTDKSLNILEMYAKQDNRIKIINQENQGVSAARNAGLEFATGDYILFVDSDDWLELNACEKINEVLSSDIDILFYNYKLKKADGSTVIEKQINQYISNKKFEFFDYIEECFECLNLRGILGKVYKQEFLQQHNIKYIKDLWFGEDTYFLISNLINNPQVYVLPENLYNYRIFAKNSLSDKNFYNKFLQYKILIDKFSNNLFADNNSDKLLEFCVINDTFRCLIYLFNEIYFSKYKKEYLSYLKLLRDNLEKYNFITKEYFWTIKFYNKTLFLANFHLAWWYWQVFRPIGKYIFVLPYRKIKLLVRRNK